MGFLLLEIFQIPKSTTKMILEHLWFPSEIEDAITKASSKEEKHETLFLCL